MGFTTDALTTQNDEYVCTEGYAHVMVKSRKIIDKNGNEITVYEGTVCDNSGKSKEKCTTGKERNVNIDR